MAVVDVNEGCQVADARIRAHPGLAATSSLLVAHRGEVVFERYYRGCKAGDLHSIHSVTKSVVSTLIGILEADELISLETPIASLLDIPALQADAAKRTITVRHLLTMSSGLDGGLIDGDQHWDIAEVARRGEPWVGGALQAPLVAEPGQVFSYNNGAAHVLSAVIAAAAGRPAEDLAAERLFTPLGIERWHWPLDPQGLHRGAGDLQLAARDLLKLGLLYLGAGAWEGTRVIAETYIRTATSSLRWDAGAPEPGSYGLLWWVADRATPAMFFAAGHGGQYVIVVPELDVVVVTMADAEAMRPPRGWLLRRLAMETIVPAFAAA